MAPWHSFSVAAFSLLFLSHLQESAGSSAASNSKNLGLRMNCFKQINRARRDVGFPDLKDGQKDRDRGLPLDDDDFVGTQCMLVAAMLGKALVHEPTRPVYRRYTTYAFTTQKGPDCQGAVDYWKAGFYNFKTIPPVYKKSVSVYRSFQNTSFISLFNPQEDATMDCAFLVCPLKDLPPGKGAGASSSDVDKVGYGLTCLSAPDAYTEGKQPFTEKQWEQIKAAFPPKPKSKL